MHTSLYSTCTLSKCHPWAWHHNTVSAVSAAESLSASDLSLLDETVSLLNAAGWRLWDGHEAEQSDCPSFVVV